MEPYMGVSHFALQLRLRCECSDGIDDDDVDRSAPHHHIGDFEPLFPAVGLGHQQIFHVYTDLLCVLWVQRVFCVDECRGAARPLYVGDHLKTQRGFSRCFGSVDFGDPSSGQSPYPERGVECERSCRDYIDLGSCSRVAESHDCAFAELSFDLVECVCECLRLVFIHGVFLFAHLFFST